MRRTSSKPHCRRLEPESLLYSRTWLRDTTAVRDDLFWKLWESTAAVELRVCDEPSARVAAERHRRWKRVFGMETALRGGALRAVWEILATERRSMNGVDIVPWSSLVGDLKRKGDALDCSEMSDVSASCDRLLSRVSSVVVVSAFLSNDSERSYIELRVSNAIILLSSGSFAILCLA